MCVRARARAAAAATAADRAELHATPRTRTRTPGKQTRGSSYATNHAVVGLERGAREEAVAEHDGTLHRPARAAAFGCGLRGKAVSVQALAIAPPAPEARALPKQADTKRRSVDLLLSQLQVGRAADVANHARALAPALDLELPVHAVLPARAARLQHVERDERERRVHAHFCFCCSEKKEAPRANDAGAGDALLPSPFAHTSRVTVCC